MSGLLVHLLSASVLISSASAAESAIREILTSGRLEGARRQSFSAHRVVLADAYDSRSGDFLWIEGTHPRLEALRVIEALGRVGARGLDPRDYEVTLLSTLAPQLGDPPLLARFDVGLSVAVVRYVSDLHAGKVRQKGVRFDFGAPAKLDLTEKLLEAARSGQLLDRVERPPPVMLQTQLLEAQLARYQKLAGSSTVTSLKLPPKVGRAESFAEAPNLAAWLTALGDLPTSTASHSTYDAKLVDAVKRFQLRHGLEVDGELGRATRKALEVPAARRARQIELALERLRWAPALEGPRVVLVNIPSFRLMAFDLLSPRRGPALQMSVVVGRAMATETPVFSGEVTSLVFAPFWHVPRSITKNELLPKLRSDLGILAAQDFEIVQEGRVLPANGASLDLLETGAAKLRQKPSAKNALGRLKFVFPNSRNIYLHETPSQRGFEAARRDFSHGCIRLEDPAALARWMLEPDGWDAADVDHALAASKTRVVTLGAPVPVILIYSTAVARPDGTIRFFEDIYGHDVRLERALRAE
ncbi:MAG: L,D-transpeptidase family protein [Deltaproteobacteria bacterium]|nr:L,D-transpeptidase family protein [Deltaproteobacteria bacterium]